MMKKVLFMATVISCLMTGTANAGWIYIGGMFIYTGSTVIETPLVGTGVVENQALLVTATLTNREGVCVNPNNHNVWKPGKAGIRVVEITENIDPDDPVIDEQGRVIVKATITNEEIETGIKCVNHKWFFVPGSAAVTEFNFTVEWVDYVYNPMSCQIEINPNPGDSYCQIDVVTLSCTLEDPQRDDDHQVVPDQPYSCFEEE